MIEVLDQGFVDVVDSYGGDGDIVAAARVSISGEGVVAKASDEGLIRYLMRNRHTTPFEMVDLKLHVKCPIFIARQWMRHRTFSYNEMSGRYSQLPEEFYVPDAIRIVKQSKMNNQGSDDEFVENPVFHREIFEEEAKELFRWYHKRLDDDMTRELARINLPVSTFTEFYVKGNLHNWFHFLSLRMHSHAQYEIRVYAEAIAKIISDMCPIAWKAFEDYRLNAMTLSAYDIAALQSQISGDCEWDEDDFPTKREYREFLEKRTKLGVDKGEKKWENFLKTTK